MADQLSVGQTYINYAIDYLIGKVRYSIWELRNADLPVINSIRADLEASIIDEIVTRQFNLISSVWNGTTSYTNFHDATSSGLDETILLNMIDTVLARAGSVRAIVGTRSALRPLYSTAGIIEHVIRTSGASNAGAVQTFGIQSILEEWKRTGRVSTIRGIPLKTLAA